MSQRKKLPIGIQSFQKIRQDDYYYVDKTALMMDLVNNGTHYFLSRPRCFGKSLFLDTLKELFEGNKALFQGLSAEAQWDWSVKYPVLTFTFGGNNYAKEGHAEKDLREQLTALSEQYQLTPTSTTCSGRFKELIRCAEKHHNQPVVILIDEYDKPMLDALHKPEIAKENRDFLRGFYGAIKDYDVHIKFSFLTGVSKFSKVSIFSGLNNVEDITLIPQFSTLCGYTDQDINTVFAAELDGLDRDEIRRWYNGYNWLGEGVYNPFDVLQCFKYRAFKNYWFETGTPTFLIDTLFKRQIPSVKLDNLLSSRAMLSSFDIEQMDTEALLFQTGYLTIKSSQRVGGQTYYTLGYPNQEVMQSLNDSLLSVMVKDKGAQGHNSVALHQLLLTNDFGGLQALFQRFFSSIPYNWYTNNDIQHYEGFYASVFYSYFASLGLDVEVEDATNLGRIDMTLLFNHQVYIFEFKVVELAPEGKALRQIKDKGYADKFKSCGQAIHLIGVEFSKATRNVVGFEVEQCVFCG